ncbi:MAG: hypothetical protein ABSD47_02250 [Candidatus Methylomirabilota bacterium]|jgi:hypothetical protein
MRRYEATFTLLPAESAKAIDPFKISQLATENLFQGGTSEELKVTSDGLHLYCDAPDKETARAWAAKTAARFACLISMKTGQYFSAIFRGLDSVPVESGQSILAPVVHQLWVDTYKPEHLREDVAVCGVAAQIQDNRFHKACVYFRKGLFYRRVVWPLLDPLDPDGPLNAAEATLNFWKAVNLILGDNISRPRAQALGINRELRQRIQQLYRRRRDRDVAHPLLDASAVQELRNALAFSQQIAGEVIEKYATFLQNGQTFNSIPAPGPRRARHSRRRA